MHKLPVPRISAQHPKVTICIYMCSYCHILSRKALKFILLHNSTRELVRKQRAKLDFLDKKLHLRFSYSTKSPTRNSLILPPGLSPEHRDGEYKRSEGTSHQEHPEVGEGEVSDRGTKGTPQA